MNSNKIKALRLAFLPASILPFVLGVVYAMQKSDINFIRVLLGAFIVGGTHLSANLINDYADSHSGADWQDLKEYNFFGGSKLIQKGILSENWYKNVAFIGYTFVFFLLAVFSFVFGPWYILPIGIFVIILSASYSLPPLKLSYRGFGELVVMVLFGPVTVCGAVVLATGILPDLDLVILSLPVAFWIGAVLLCNEIADFKTDKLTDKKTLVVKFGTEKSSLLYLISIFLAALVTLFLNVQFGKLIALIEICFGIIGYFFIRKYNGNPEKMKIPAKITVVGHAVTLVLLIVNL